MRMQCFAAIAVGLVMASARPAAASLECDGHRPHFGTNWIPLGCPLVVYQATSYPHPLMIYVNRGDRTTSVVLDTTVVGHTVRSLAVTYVTECEGEELSRETRATDYDVLSIDLGDARVGEGVGVGLDGATVAPAGPCPAQLLEPQICRQQADDCGRPDPDDDHRELDNGCAAGGSGGGVLAGLAAAVLAFARRRGR